MNKKKELEFRRAVGIRLWHGDNQKRLLEIPDNAIDAVLCDPPYG